MHLRGIDFGHVFNASGARGFYGEGYWYHKYWRPFGLNYEGSTFVAKTTTLMPRLGNMPLDVDGCPIDLVPDCIVVKPAAGVTLNAVGLSGPGILTLTNTWKKSGREWKTPGTRFVVSIMSVANSPEERFREAKAMFSLLKPVIDAQGVDPPSGLKMRMALQINFSCPNVGLDTSHLVDEASLVLGESQKLGIPTMVKINALVPVEVADLMVTMSGCDALVVSNTIPWGQMPDRIDWKGLFGSDKSPLAKYGGGGLSGKPLLPIVIEWIAAARKHGITKPIIGGGGILSKEDAGRMIAAGASAIELGSVSILRPWRVQGIIRYVNSRLGAN
jgi:dihydroorotate dehydrogenase